MHDRRKHCVRNTISVSVPVRKMFSLCQRSRASSPKPPERQNFPLPLNLRLDFTTCVMARGWTGCWAFGKLRPAEVFEHHYHPPPRDHGIHPPSVYQSKNGWYACQDAHGLSLHPSSLLTASEYSPETLSHSQSQWTLLSNPVRNRALARPEKGCQRWHTLPSPPDVFGLGGLMIGRAVRLLACLA